MKSLDRKTQFKYQRLIAQRRQLISKKFKTGLGYSEVQRLKELDAALDAIEMSVFNTTQPNLNQMLQLLEES